MKRSQPIPPTLYLAGTLIALLLTGCTLGQKSPTPNESGGESPVPPGFTPALSPTPAYTPTPTRVPRTLTICLGAEPETLYLYGGGSLAQSQVLQAIYDGPIDDVGFDYQPVILEKLPDLADGDALIQPVAVQAGDWVVNAAGELVRLSPGQVVRPFGCDSAECAVAWNGEPLEMAQLSATFTIKEGVRWSDGTPLTAADSVFSYKIARDCQSESGPCGGFGLVNQRGWDTLQRTASYTALGERQVQWTGVPGFLDPDYRINFFIPLPADQLQGIAADELFTAEASARQPMGWGPYAIQEWVPGESIRLSWNPSYFRAGEGLPAFDTLVFRFAGQDPRANLEAIQAGECDLLDQEASLAFQEDGFQALLAAQEAGRLAARIQTGTVWEHADFGIRPASYDDGNQLGVDRPDFFGDVRTRQALAQCIDRQRIVDEVLFGLSAVPDSYLPPGHPLLNPDVARYPFDPAAGAALLDQVGWLDGDGNPATPRVALGVPNVVDGTPLQFTYRTTPASQRQRAAEILKDSLAQCGVALELVTSPAEELYAAGPQGPVFGRQFDLAQLAWSTGVHPSCNLWLTSEIPGDPNVVDENGVTRFPLGWGGQNASGYSSPAYDRACLGALDPLPGQPGYEESHRETQAIFAQDLPVVPLYWRVKAAATRPDFCGFELDAAAHSELWNLEAFDYGEGCSEAGE